MAKHFIGIVAFKGGAFLDLTLESVCRSMEGTGAELIIVENGITEEASPAIARWLKLSTRPVHHIQNLANRGFPAGCNQVFDKFLELTSDPQDLLTLTHTDVYWPKTLCSEIERIFPRLVRSALAPYTTNTTEDVSGTLQTYFTRMLAFHRQNDPLSASECYKKPGLLKQRLFEILGVDSPEQLEPELARLLDKLKGSPLVPGADNSCYTISRQLLCEVGYFDEIFYPGMGEDSDFAERLGKAGYTVFKTPEIFCHHWTSVTYTRCGDLDGGAIHADAMAGLLRVRVENAQGTRPRCLRRACVRWRSCTHSTARYRGKCSFYEFNPEYGKKK